MKRIGIIGADEFGSILAIALAELGVEVILIDRDEERIQRHASVVTKAITADATDKTVLAEAGLAECDAVVVTLGDKVEQSVTATLLLKEIKVPRVVVKASSEVHGKILSSLGADQVVFPDGERARRLAKVLAWEMALDYVGLAPGYGILQLDAPWNICGKTLGESKLVENFKVTILLLQHKKGTGVKRKPIVHPGPETVVEAGDRLVIFGADEDLERLAREA